MSGRQMAQTLPAGQRVDGGSQGAGSSLVTRPPELSHPSPAFDFGKIGIAGGSQGGGQQQQVAQVADITFSTGSREVHVPLMGIAQVTARTSPANVPNITWSLAAGTAQVASATAVSTTGAITFDPAQTPGTITVKAEQALPGGATVFVTRDLRLSSHPSGIGSTSDTGGAVAATDYGSVFDHSFTAAAGTTADIENVPVGEKFPALPNPNGTTHTFATPFGQLTLNTKNLAATPGNGLNWFVTGGGLGGTHDNVTMGRAGINLGSFLASASNPTPATPLSGATFDAGQELHWFCWQDSSWRLVAPVTHRRALINPSSGPKFRTTVNGTPHDDDYTGHPAIVQAMASPATIPPSVTGQPASTSTVSATTFPGTLPAGHSLRFSLRPPALGCTINATTGVLTAGTQTGVVTVRVRDLATANPNFDETQVTIAVPQAPPPQPVPPTTGGAAVGTGTTPEIPPADVPAETTEEGRPNS